MTARNLGLHRDDLDHLDRLGNQELVSLGFLDVTAAPFHADPTGKTDSTIAIADAVFFARHHKLAVWFPAGDYLVSDTIRCEGGWCDLRTTNYKYLPYCELWGCVLMGDQRGGSRARIVLAERAPGFDDPGNPKPVLDYISRIWRRATMTAKPASRNGATGMNQTLLGIDVQVRSGNPGAAAVSFDAAEGCTIQDCVFDVGEGYTAIHGGPGSGGAIFNMKVRGGRIGALLNSPRPPCTLVACSFADQRESAVDYCQRGTLTLVGCDFRLPRGVPALRVLGSNGNFLPSASVIDCRVEYPAGPDPATCVETQGAVYLRNVWAKQAQTACQSREFGAVGELRDGWTRVAELAVAARYPEPIFADVYVDGVKQEQPFQKIEPGGEPPADLCARHIWTENTFPVWNSPAAVNVKTAYGATGDGITDDTIALQQAIDDHEIVFLPRGAYRVSRTLRLKPNTKLLGVHAPYSMIAPLATAGGDFNDPAKPRPVLQTADVAEADTQLAWFSVFLPRELAPGAFLLDWRCGGNSRLRCVFPITGYTQNELEPLAKGIYPWTNWSWADFEFPNAVDFVRHYTQDGPEPPGMDQEAVPQHPLTVVRGHGAGGWYPFMALDGRSHGPGYRRILVQDCAGPFRVYHAHLQYCRGKAEMEIAGSRDVAVYGIKNEEDAIVVWAHDSTGILVTGFGGVGRRNPTGKFLIENCRDTVLTCLLDDAFAGPRPKADAHLPQLREIAPDGREFVSPPYDRIALYRRR